MDTGNTLVGMSCAMRNGLAYIFFGYDGENKVKTPVEDYHTTAKKLTEVCILKICN